METEALVKEIIDNARKDRKRLEDVSDALVQVSSLATGEEDPLTKAALAEQLAKVTDSLTRTNQQLVELVKMTVKQADGKPGSISDSDKESLYDQIEETVPVEE